MEVLDGNYNSSLSIERFCGFGTPRDIRSSGRYMRVRFKSDSESTYFRYRGFKASFIAEDGPSTCKSKCSLKLENANVISRNTTLQMEPWSKHIS